jgi:hypothetical protein
LSRIKLLNDPIGLLVSYISDTVEYKYEIREYKLRGHKRDKYRDAAQRVLQKLGVETFRDRYSTIWEI